MNFIGPHSVRIRTMTAGFHRREERAYGLAKEAAHRYRTAYHRPQRLEEHVPLRGYAFRLPRMFWRGHWSPSGLEIEEEGGKLRPRYSVNRRMMRLGHQGSSARLQAPQHVDLPQRAIEIQRATDQVGGELTQLVHATRGPQSTPAKVVVEIEVRVIDPDRMVEMERHLHRSTPERRKKVKPALYHCLQAIKGKSASLNFACAAGATASAAGTGG